MKKIVLAIIVFCALLGAWFVYSEIYSDEAMHVETVSFEVKEGESVSALAARLADAGIVRHAWLFRKYVAWKGIDTDIRFGTYEVAAPITLARVVLALGNPSTLEREITILPGWNLDDIGTYLETEGIATKEEFFGVVGKPAVDYRTKGGAAPHVDVDLRVLQDKPAFVSYEGYLAPDTYRIYKDATVEDVVLRLLHEREDQLTDQMVADIRASGRSVYEVLTLASILEREVRTPEDRAIVADMFWRRLDLNWALQADSTVHYAVQKKGDVFTTALDRASSSLWNTYQYPGLPLGPIATPSLSAIRAAIYPTKNDYWFFLTTSDGEVKYAKTLEEHNRNRLLYLQ